MAKSRHVFVCKDGNPLPEWLKLSGSIESVAQEDVSRITLASTDIVWVRLSSADIASAGNVDLVKQIANLARCVVMADIPGDEDALVAFAAGARGYCNSHANSRVLKLIARVVEDGGLWIGESLMQRLVTGIGKTIGSRVSEKQTAEVMASLTDREREVAETIAGGASNKEVARLLQISERTVKAHVTTIFNKLDVRDRLQLTIKIKMLK